MIQLEDGGFKYTFTDKRGITTSYVYNALGQIISEDAPEQGKTVRRYNETGELAGITGPGGLDWSTTYAPTETGQSRIAEQVARANGKPTITSRYDYGGCQNGEGLLCTVEHNMHETSFAYTPDGQLASYSVDIHDESVVETIEYTYHEDGNLNTMTYPSGLVVTHNYGAALDGTQRVVSLTGNYAKRARNMPSNEVNFTIVSDITYDEDGVVAGFTHGNGVRTELNYDSDGNLFRTTVSEGGSALDTRALKYDADDRITSIARSEAALSRAYTYDQRGRLTSEIRGVGISNGSQQVDYKYDLSNNRISRTVDGRARIYNYANDSNRLVSQGRRGRRAFDYDFQGNLLEDRGGKRRFTYDATNRLSEFYKNGQLRASYDYDFSGMRLRKRFKRGQSDGTKSVRFMHDITGRLVSETSRRDNGRAVSARDTVWLGSMPIVQVDRRVRPDGTTRRANVLYLHTDHQGAVRWARDRDARMVWSWEDADAFGGPLSGKSAINRDPDGDGKNVTIPLRFPGQYHDRESELYHNHFRDYDPQLARYVQTDPIGLDGGINRYAYVKGDPVNFVDPNGLEPVSVSTLVSLANLGRFIAGFFGGGNPRAQLICLDNPAEIACEPAPGPGPRIERSFSDRLVYSSPLQPSNSIRGSVAVKENGLYNGAGPAVEGTHVVVTPQRDLGIITRTTTTLFDPNRTPITFIRDRTMPGHVLHPTIIFIGITEYADADPRNNLHYQIIAESDNSNARNNLITNLSNHINGIIRNVSLEDNFCTDGDPDIKDRSIFDVRRRLVNATDSRINIFPQSLSIPDISIPNTVNARGFTTLNLNDHIYNIFTDTRGLGLSPEAVANAFANNPTPGNDLRATPSGARNNVGPIVLMNRFQGGNWVHSFTVPSPDSTRWTDFVVNYTIAGEHLLNEGYVLQFGVIEDGEVIGLRSYGEGQGFLQDPSLRFAWCRQVPEVWNPVHQEVIEAARHGVVPLFEPTIPNIIPINFGFGFFFFGLFNFGNFGR